MNYSSLSYAYPELKLKLHNAQCIYLHICQVHHNSIDKNLGVIAIVYKVFPIKKRVGRWL